MKVINVHDDSGQRCGLLVKTLRKYHYVLFVDNPLRIRKIPLKDEKFFTDLLYKGNPYPVKRFIRAMKRCANTWQGGMRNINKDVKDILTQKHQ